MFGFDERFAMFDITPVENQFILEYLPGAKGDYVKVYLYGLMRCYHPEEGLSMERMCRELNISEDDAAAAFRYWERRGLVRRISDKPPKWQYVNIKQKSLTASEEPDPRYEEFSNAVYDAFDKVRRLHGSELSTCFEWQEDLKLPTEVIIMLLNHMVEMKGRNFRISDAGKVAVRMAEENIRTVEAADEFFSRDEKTYAGVREVLKKLGKNYAPSEAQVKLYLKWIKEWRFTHQAILEAVELTAKGDPSMGYLDGILNSLRREAGGAETLGTDQVRDSAGKAEELRTVLKALGRGEVSQRNLELYDQMKALYPQTVILTAARECGRTGKSPEEILKLLQAWKSKGLEDEQQVDAYVKTFHDQTSLIRELHQIWGMDGRRIGQTDRSLISKWENELSFGRDMILAAASLASDANAPMSYLNGILTDCRSKGIDTPEALKREQVRRKTADGKKKPGHTVLAQQYDQRDYSGVQDEMMEELGREMDAYRTENGGKPDA